MGYKLHDKALIAFSVLVFVLSTAYYYLFQAQDPARCGALLQDGFWLNPTALLNWQPAGCMLHTYKPAEAVGCLESKRTVFMGGQQTLNLYEAVTKRIDPSYEAPPLARETNHLNSPSNANLEFYWDPTLEGTEIERIASDLEAGALSSTVLIVLGNELDFVLEHQNLTLWADHVETIFKRFGRRQSTARASGSTLNNGVAASETAIVMTPLVAPSVHDTSINGAAAIAPESVQSMNDVLNIYSANYGLDVASAYTRLLEGPSALTNASLPDTKAVGVMSDILFNRVCNTKLPQHYPYASTCCNSYPRPNWIQIIGFTFVAMLVPAAVYWSYKGFTPESSKFLAYMPAAKYRLPILTMGLTVLLCYYCDRTNILGKEQKQTSPSQFFMLMGLIIGASLFTLKTSDKDLAFLNRDQTDEWKGWMQVAILVYHYVGVSKTAYIYNYMRVCPTSYLFMTGFGHTVYFLKKGDFSLKRVVATMLRLNLLNVVLAYAMGNDWLLYYFAPLVTWNFFVLYMTFYIGRSNNSNISFLVLKIVLAALFNASFNLTPNVLETFWAVLQTMLNMQGDLREWRFRVTLDRFSMFPGMLCGILFVHWDSLTLPKSANFRFYQRVTYAVCVVIMLLYAVFEVSQPSKQVYNTKHPFVSWLPCVAYVLLRNSTSYLRRTHNGFFAWVGRGSLETFLLQFHIWLAADTAGLLLLTPPHWRFFNALISTVIFMYVSSLVTQATGPVIEWIMSGEQGSKAGTLPTAAPGAQQPKSTATIFIRSIDAESRTGNEAIQMAAVQEKLQSQVQAKALSGGGDPEKALATIAVHTRSLNGSSSSSSEHGDEDYASDEIDGVNDRMGVLGRAANGLVEKARGLRWSDLRVRTAAILLGMVIANWTY